MTARLSRCALVVCLGLPLLLTGCVGIAIERPGGEIQRWSQVEFRAHAVNVFRHQNRLSATVIEMIEDDLLDSAALGPIETAEVRMMDACKALNAAAARAAAKQRVSLRQRRAVIDEMVGCEAATLQLEALLEGRR